LKSGFS